MKDVVGSFERKNVLNVVGPFLAAYGGVAFFCFLYLIERWAHAAPTNPNTAHGYIFAHNEHGRVTYFSPFQTTAATLLMLTSIPLSFVGILASPKRDVVYRRGFLSVSAKWNPDDPKRLQRFGFVVGAAAAPILIFLLGPFLIKSLNASGIVLSFG